jgi:hypothetical protein
MNTERNFLIVGGGLAGAIAAETLRDEGFEGRVTILGEESHLPYERPPLSKDYLQGNADRDSIFVNPKSWYLDHAIELRLSAAVTSLDPASRTVVTATGARLGYDKLLLPPARRRDASACRGPTSTVSATCVASMTVITSNPASSEHGGSPSSAGAGSGSKRLPLLARQGWRSPFWSAVKCHCYVSLARRLRPSSLICTGTMVFTCVAKRGWSS